MPKPILLSDRTKPSALWGPGILLVLLFVASIFIIGETVMASGKLSIDQWAFELAGQTPQWVTSAMLSVTKAGSVLWLTVLSVMTLLYLLFLSPFSRYIGLYFAINMIGVSGITKLLKISYMRERPDQTQYTGDSSSFPSGHTSGAVAFYGFLIYLISISHLSNGIKWTVNVVLTIFMLAIGLSRVFGSIHFFTDVLAGFAIGFTWLMICIAAIEWTLKNKRQSQESSNEPNVQA